jgi:hypothetical protein
MKLSKLEEQKIFKVNVRGLSEEEIVALSNIEPYMDS